MKHLLLVFVLLLILSIPVMAQDATVEPTVVSIPAETIPDENTGTGIVCEDGATCNLNEEKETPLAATNIDDILGLGIVVVLALLLAVLLVFGRQFVGLLSKLVPPETAASIYESGVRFGYQIALNRAAATANPYDDEFFLTGAKSRGYTVTKMPDGTYVVEPPVFTNASPATTTVTTTTSTGADFTTTAAG